MNPLLGGEGPSPNRTDQKKTSEYISSNAISYKAAFSFRRLNRCALCVCVLMLAAIPAVLLLRIVWVACVLLGAGGIIFLLLFYAYQRKVVDFFDEVNEDMEQMFSREREVRLPEVQDQENTFSRFVSKLSRLYEALRIAEADAEEEKCVMQGMIAELSHQIKTPVANIKMDLELLSSRKMPEETRQGFLERTLHQADKMDFLIRAIIKMSRLESGAIQLLPQNADLAQTLVNALLSISAAAEQKEIEIIVDCPQPLIIRHDPKWTEEAIFNLLDNAVKYTSPGGTIKVCAETREIGVYLSITDNGMGIPEELQGVIFSKFFRAPAVHNMPGAGVGLYLTRQILEAQGCYVTVNSDFGDGSTFSIQFL